MVLLVYGLIGLWSNRLNMVSIAQHGLDGLIGLDGM